MNRLSAALIAVVCLAPLSSARASSELLTKYFGESAASVDQPQAAPHQVVVEPVQFQQSDCPGWQAWADPHTGGRRPSPPVYTHRPYRSPAAAARAAVAACRAMYPQWASNCKAGEPYFSHSCH